MATDREMLELAAKAAGYEVHQKNQAERDAMGCGHVGLWLQSGHSCWNPLTDDGPAFRLACKLKLSIAQGDFSAGVSDEDEIDDAAFVRSDEERTAVVRRLIVRAAAAMAAPPAVGAQRKEDMSLDVYLTDEAGNEVYSRNITHNLNRMAAEAGIYECLWRPDEHGITHARQIIEPLAAGVAKLATEKRRFEEFNSPNGWGLWEHFVPFCMDYLQACRDNPDALVNVSR